MNAVLNSAELEVVRLKRQIARLEREVEHWRNIALSHEREIARLQDAKQPEPQPLRECRMCKAHLIPEQTICSHCGTRN